MSKITPSQKENLLDALNILDEYASAYTVDNNPLEGKPYGEAEQVAKEYKKLYNFIKSL